MGNPQAELDKINQAIATQETLRGIVSDEQIAATLSRFFASEMENVVILKVDTTLLLAKLVYEPAGDELFPHIFGGINKNAIVEILGEEFIRNL